jgi:threonine/homoserine/homoserine lactone efflux protein
MNGYLKVFFAGLAISFLGSLPLGTQNITAFHIASLQNVGEAIWFALAVVIVELIIVRITLTAADKIDFGSKPFFYVLPIAVVLLLYLAISSFVSSAGHQGLGTNTNLFPMLKSSILLGTLLGLLNPMHIPFWMGWNSVLTTRKILHKKPGMYPSYITGIGLGSIGGLLAFIFSGKYIFKNYQQYGYVLTSIMGCLYLGLSFYILVLLYKKHLKLNIR